MKAAFHTLGCKVNHYETEAVKEAFVSRGAEIVGGEDFADVYVINTCTVTGIADRKSRQFIRRAKRINPDAAVIVTGCYAQTSPEEVQSMPEVDAVIGNSLKTEIADRAFALYEQKRSGGSFDRVCHVLGYDELRDYEDMGIVSSDGSSMCRAYIKIEEGCNRFCSYCLIPYARGRVRSRRPEEIVEEAKGLIGRGCREIVLTGINTALYGTEEGFSFERMEDEAGLPALAAVIKRIDALEGDFRIRLSSLEPTVVDVNDVKRLLGFGKLCHHLHLSIQSGSGNVLSRMNRHYTPEDYLEITRALKEFDPDYGITTDIIAGFPGETEDDHHATLGLIEKAGFGRVHVFRYSQRKGTKAEAMKDQVPGDVKARRAAELSEAADRAFAEYATQNMGRSHRVLAEEHEDAYMTGYTDNYIRTYIKDEKREITAGDFLDVRIKGLFRDGVLAEIEVQ